MKLERIDNNSIQFLLAGNSIHSETNKCERVSNIQQTHDHNSVPVELERVDDGDVSIQSNATCNRNNECDADSTKDFCLVSHIETVNDEFCPEVDDVTLGASRERFNEYGKFEEREENR